MLILTQRTTPAAPGAGKVRIYLNSVTGRVEFVHADSRVSSPGDADLGNVLRNSGFWFAQRQPPAVATNCGSTTLRAGGGASGCDGWGVWNENANTTYQRVDTSGATETGLQGRFYGSFAKVTTTGKFFVSQMVEGSDACAVRGRVVRVQAWAKGTGAQTMRLGLVQLNSAGTIDTLPATFISAAGVNGTDPTLGTNLAYVAPLAGQAGDNCAANGNAFDCALTAAWQRFGGVFTVPTNCKNLLACFWTNAQLAAASGFSLAQASITDGYEIQNWTPFVSQQELSRCQRYYFKTFNVDTAPSQNVGLNTGEFKFMSTVVGALAMAGVGFRYPLSMRAAANTLTLYNPSAANAQVRDVTDAADQTASAVTANGEQGCWLTCTGAAGNAAGEHLAVHLSADAAGANNEFA